MTVSDDQETHGDLSNYLMVGDILYKFICSFRLEVPVRHTVCCVHDTFLKQFMSNNS